MRDIINGAGLGFFSEPILKATKAKVSSCDFSPSAIQNERDRCSKYPNFSGAYLVDELIEQDKTFDVIFCLEVVEHCNDDYLKKHLKILKNFCVLVESSSYQRQIMKIYEIILFVALIAEKSFIGLLM